MTAGELEKLIVAHRVRGEKTIAALRLVLIDGLTAYEAAQIIGTPQSLISRAKQRLERPLCPHCGQPMRDEGKS